MGVDEVNPVAIDPLRPAGLCDDAGWQRDHQLASFNLASMITEPLRQAEAVWTTPASVSPAITSETQSAIPLLSRSDVCHSTIACHKCSLL
jgi:hypothetical protein